MAKTVTCDFCGEPGTAGVFEKRVALPKEFVSEQNTRAGTARVQIHVYAEDGRLTIPELCDKHRMELANAPVFVPPPKPAPVPPVPKAPSPKPEKS